MWWWLLLVSCGYDFRLRGDPSCCDPCETQLYFVDEDGDGWGVGEGQEAWEPDEVYRVRNNVDCDDADPLVTARVGGACPDQLLPGQVEHVGVALAGREYLLTLASTPTVGSSAATVACGPTGWGGTGGGLAVLDSETEAGAVIDALTALGGGTWFVGARPSAPGTSALEEPPVGGWQWASPLVLGQGSLPPCGSTLPPGVQAADRLALVVTAAGRACLDGPEDGTAWFLCERPVPHPDDYAVSLNR